MNNLRMEHGVHRLGQPHAELADDFGTRQLVSMEAFLIGGLASLIGGFAFAALMHVRIRLQV